MKATQFLNSMYGWVIVLLIVLVGVGSYIKHAIPINLIVAVIVCSVLDLVIKLVLKKNLKFPASAFITGLIIGSVAQFAAPVWIVLLASVLAIGSKFVIRLKNQHIFNPATFGLLISLFLLSSGDEWWTSVTFGVSGFSILLTPLLILPNYKALKLGVSLPFLLVTGILFYATSYVPFVATASGFLDFMYALPYFFVFVMVSEPKTSPYKLREQIVFGVLVAALTFVLLFFGVKYYLLISLLVGNLGFSIFRNYLQRSLN